MLEILRALGNLKIHYVGIISRCQLSCPSHHNEKLKVRCDTLSFPKCVYQARLGQLVKPNLMVQGASHAITCKLDLSWWLKQ